MAAHLFICGAVKEVKGIKTFWTYALVCAVIVVCIALSWITVVGVIKLITLCFAWEFSLRAATGIWLLMGLVSMMFGEIARANDRR